MFSQTGFLFYNKLMRLPNNLGLKIYVALFAVYCLSNLANLSLAAGEAYIYYNTLLTLHNPSRIWYVLAIMDNIFSCLCLIPLTRRAFTRPRQDIKFFQWLFLLRLATLLPGNHYPYMIVKAAFNGSSTLGMLTIGTWAIFIFPSFKEHYTYAFKK